MPNAIGNTDKTGSNSSNNGSNLNIGSSNRGSEGQSLGASGEGKLPLPPGREAPPSPAAHPPPTPPPPPAPKPPASPPQPPPQPAARPPPQPPKPGNLPKPAPPGPRLPPKSAAESSEDKTKLKPFFWDKVLANPDQQMVWHDIKAGSFQCNEDLMESLFGYKAAQEQQKIERKKEHPTPFEVPKYIQIIDPRKAQNLSILLRALNVTTDEVCEAILEGNELPAELIQTLLKMAPTTDEELKLRLFNGDRSQLGPAEKFLKTMVDIPFAFKRLESLLFMCTVQEEVASVKHSFANIEVACNEIRSSRVFLKLLEAVLKTGNRMNVGTYRGGAQAFKLDTLLKLSDVKGTDGKTTLLHFVVLEIIRTEGIRAARKVRRSQSLTSVKTEDILEDSTKETAEYVRSLGLEVVSNLSSELEHVKKAAFVDGDTLKSTVLKLGQSLKQSKDFLKNEMGSLDEESEFRVTLASFVQQAEDDIIWLLEEEKKISTLVKSTSDYFHGTAGKDEGLRLFVIVRDFLAMVDKVCDGVKKSSANSIKTTKKMTSNVSSTSQASPQTPSPTLPKNLFPSISDHRENNSESSDFSSSDDES
ncbi:hypothetical protein DCAR_0521984 [Daucus carota subsp. sativus]|uniref:Formin-like protein n=2 Tax=Daucus carota subsp. sativus TaxID=79200 RepID=A0AAF0X712_DAUCS|nr:hypothetical protein DCAR_0521984 [Daucus carota subsp. sativus]